VIVRASIVTGSSIDQVLPGDVVGVVVSNRPLGRVEMHTATPDEVEVLVTNTLKAWADWYGDGSPFGP
jgi:hypothetical protein